MERWFGREILDHSRAGIDLTYAARGLPFLMDHDTRTQIGVLEDVALGKDGKLRAMARPGNHPDAAWVFADIRSGIRPHISIGYRVLEMKLEESGERGDTYRVTRWMPMEGSTVPVPADITVGVGRSMDRVQVGDRVRVRDGMAHDEMTKDVDGTVREISTNAIGIEFDGMDGVHKWYVASELEAASDEGRGFRASDSNAGVGRATPDAQQFPVQILDSRKAQEVPMSGTENQAAPASGAAVGVGVGRDFDAERKARNAELANLATLAGMPETLADALSRDLSPAQYARELQDKKIEAAANLPSAGVQLTPRESQSYSVLRALGAQVAMMQGNPRAWEAAGFEREVSNEIAKRMGADTGRLFVPMGMQVRVAVTGQTAGTTSLGGAGVQTTVLDLIELLRNNMVVRQAGARVLTGLSSNITFPRQTAANTLSWTGENPSTGNANTNMTFDNVTLSPKTAMVSTAASRQAILQFNQDLEQIVRDDLAQVIARGLDLAALDGTGSSNQPTGVMRASGTSTVTTTFGSNGAVPDWAAIVQFETTLASSNAPTAGGWKWITTPGIRGKLKQTLQNTVAGANWVWEGNGTMNGYEALVTTQMPTNYTAGTSTTICHGMVLGNWPELLIGEFGGGIEIIVDPYTVASQNMIQYHAVVMADIAIRHGASFALTKAAKVA